jgi:hypothetical protein
LQAASFAEVVETSSLDVAATLADVLLGVTSSSSLVDAGHLARPAALDAAVRSRARRDEMVEAVDVGHGHRLRPTSA